MLKVLFIEDEPKSIETLIEKLKKVVQELICKTEKFNDAESALHQFLPDLVVLDIFKGDVAESDTAGLENYNFIWDKCFCPIVVYSAFPDYVSDEIKEHPFIRSVKKGKNSESEVISHIQQFIPHIDALNGVQSDIRQHINRQLRDIAPVVFGKITDEEGKAVFGRVARRRIAAMMDNPLNEEIASWEQYLYPPVGNNLLTGDILKKKGSDEKKTNNYYVVLTPSCDMVSDEHRGPKVEKVLVAGCTDVKNMLPEVNAETTTRSERLKEKLLPFLRRGYGNFCLPLPEFPGILPPMTAELKNLKLLELNKIGDDAQSEYCRIVSVDSPFREMAIWAYIQVTGRPGLPERNFDTWADEICSAVASQEETENVK